MTTEQIFSPVKDEKMASNLLDSPIWKESYTEDEYLMIKETHAYDAWYKYTIKFEGLKPIQLTKFDVL